MLMWTPSGADPTVWPALTWPSKGLRSLLGHTYKQGFTVSLLGKYSNTDLTNLSFGKVEKQNNRVMGRTVS